MTIRALTVDDVEVYRAIRLRSLRSDPEGFSSNHDREAAFDEATWRSRLLGFDDRPGQIFVDHPADATQPRGVVGVGLSGRPGDAVLWGMWVARDARGEGVGRRLADAAIGWAREHGLATVTLWVMRTNAGARRLYERCGFTELPDAGDDAPDGCSDEVRMRLELVTTAPRGAATDTYR